VNFRHNGRLYMIGDASDAMYKSRGGLGQLNDRR
jgi:hypothetical protein